MSPEKKKKIKWQKEKAPSAMEENSSLGNASSIIRDDSSCCGFGKLIAFLFSPLGVVAMFAVVNYPWLKQYFGVTFSISNDVPKPSAPVLEEPKLASPMASDSGNPRSPDCRNPLKKLLDHHCRLEVKKRRHEKKLEEIRKRKKKHQQHRKRRQAPPVYGNETLVQDTSDFSVPFFGSDLDCANILSRECRQKKRLLAQIATLTKESPMN